MRAAVVSTAKTNRIGSAPSRRSSNASGKRGHTHRRPQVGWKAGGIVVDCLICRGLERALESRRSQYIEARSAAYYQVSTELAAYKNVDMERAKSDLEEHQLVCVAAAEVRPYRPKSSRLDSTLWRHAGNI
jgi:hypothetical protein